MTVASLALAAAALAAGRPAAPAPAAPAFDPITFFAGHTEGVGDLKVALRRSAPVSVHGFGTVAADGTLVLDQVVERYRRPPARRQWRIRAVAPGRWAGTLSDARGPVVGERVGDRLRLSYRLAGGFAVSQWLTLAADGRSAHNVLRVRLRGVVVARLDETIRRAGS